MSAIKFTEAVINAKDQLLREEGNRYKFDIVCQEQYNPSKHVIGMYMERYSSYGGGLKVLTLDEEDISYLNEKYTKQVPAEKKKNAEEDYLREKEELDRTVEDLRKKLDDAITKMKKLLNKEDDNI